MPLRQGQWLQLPLSNRLHQLQQLRLQIPPLLLPLALLSGNPPIASRSFVISNNVCYCYGMRPSVHTKTISALLPLIVQG